MQTDESTTSTRESNGRAQPWRFKVSVEPTDLGPIDYEGFAKELKALRAELVSQLGEADLKHLRKMEWWGRGCAWVGYLTAWIFPNPVSAWLIAQANITRWAMIAHHVSHRGYDKVPNVPKRYQSKHFAVGWRRYIDWLDWMHPDAWAHEHNVLHHYRTGEVEDPDLAEHNAWLIRAFPWPRPIKWAIVVFLMATWKSFYYAPNSLWALQQHLRIRNQSAEEKASKPLPTHASVWRLMFPGERLLVPVHPRAWEHYLRCLLPYGLVRFGLLPALFLPLGQDAWMYVLVNSMIAEVIANVYAFIIIVPNHAGDDVYRFDRPITDQAEFFVRQVVGSVNYHNGTDLKDFAQGWLNYQIEHHLWPDLPMLKYRQAAPRVKEICARYGVPYVEQSVFKRFGKLWDIMVGNTSMKLTETVPAPLRRKKPVVADAPAHPHPEQSLSSAG